MRLFLSKPSRINLDSSPGLLISRSMAPHWTVDDFEKYNIEVQEYHWDSRDKLIKDSKIINEIVAEVVGQLSVELNEIHGLNEDEKYWALVIGEWSYLFSQIVFDRWSSITQVRASHSEIEVLAENSAQNNSPIDTREFLFQATMSTEWNSNLYHEIASIILVPNVELIFERKLASLKYFPKRKKKNFRWLLKSGLNLISTWISKPGNGILLQKTYLKTSELLKLAIKLRQIPYFETETLFSEIDKKLPLRRISLKPSRKLQALAHPELVEVLCKLTPKYLPQVYLELFDANKRSALKKYGRRIPRVIVTANSFSLDEEWKKWAAFARSRGSKVAIIQHGGLYGANLFSLIQEYELLICDYFLTWGWENNSNSQIISSHPTKLIGHSMYARKPKSGIKFIAFEMPLHSYWLASMPIGPQVIDSAMSSIDFINKLESKIRKDLMVLPYPTDYGLNARERFQTLLPPHQISSGELSFLESVRSSKMVVTNYNGTTYIQTFALNIPTVIFWDKNLWEIDNRFADVFEGLENVQVLFYSPEECAEFVNTNYENVEKWWYSDNVQNSIQRYLSIFGNVDKDSLWRLATQIKSL